MMNTLERAPDDRMAWVPCIPFLAMHFVPLGALFTGAHWSSWIVAFVLYYARVFFITGGYHRYLAHRSFTTSRVVQFLLALGGTTAVQKGPLWWAAHHRHHHKYSDQAEDVHSPKKGLFWSHIGWILCRKYDFTREELIPDLMKYPELRWLNRWPAVPPLVLALLVLGLGWLITRSVEGAFGYVFVGFFLSTVALWHATFLVNSFTHIWGRRRFATRDTSRNSMLIALLTGGEGWHNNHHHFQISCRQGFYWWEIDITWYILLAMSKLRLVGNLRAPNDRALTRHLIKQGATDIGMFQKHWERALAALTAAQNRTGELAAEQKAALEKLLADTRAKVEEIARITAGSEPAGNA